MKTKTLFIGNAKDFNKFVGPRLKKIVRKLEAKTSKNKSHCSHCGTYDNLHHPSRGENPKAMINVMLQNYGKNDQFVVDLEHYEKTFKASNVTAGSGGETLCKSCNAVYKKHQPFMENIPQETNNKAVINPQNETKSSAQPKAMETTSEDEEKIGSLVQRTLPQLLENGHISDDEIENMQSLSYSKVHFDVNFQVLKKVTNPQRIHETRFINGYARYYAQPVNYKGQMYLITSQWYQYSYQPYKAWLQKYKQS